MAMLRFDNLFIIFGAILFILTSISVISFTSKFIFGFAKTHKTNLARQVYDPDVCNATVICPFAMNAYQVHYNRTACFNKTMHYRYIPWVRFDVWRKFREMNDEKKRKRAKELEAIDEGENETNEAQNGNGTEKADAVFGKSAIREGREDPSKVACTILAILLALSSIIALGEVVKEKIINRKNNSMAGLNNNLSAVVEDLMYMRSLSDEQSPEAVLSVKVTQALVHQTSLDKAFSRLTSEVNPFYLRRESVLSQMTAPGLASNTPDSGFIIDSHLQSSDTAPIRRGSRHFIRRH